MYINIYVYIAHMHYISLNHISKGGPCLPVFVLSFGTALHTARTAVQNSGSWHIARAHHWPMSQRCSAIPAQDSCSSMSAAECVGMARTSMNQVALSWRSHFQQSKPSGRTPHWCKVWIEYFYDGPLNIQPAAKQNPPDQSSQCDAAADTAWPKLQA